VTGNNFINRAEDIKRIQNNLVSSINTIIISPRRWGKSSLMKQVELKTKSPDIRRRWGKSSLMKQVELKTKSPDIRFAFIDFFTIRNEEDFYKTYMKEILRCTISRKEELLNAGKEFFKRIIPVLSFSIDPQQDLSVNLNWKEARQSRDEIINLPEIIAKKKRIRIVVCIDEFQHISRIKDYITFEKELRSWWQQHKNVSYCLYGSRKHMMIEIFKKESRAFYRFGDLIMLDKIERDHWIKFIIQSFRKTNKTIAKEFAEKIIDIADKHPDYIQQICHHAWNLTEGTVNHEIITEALDLVLRSNKVYYQNICESISNTQYNLLIALMNNEKHLTSAATMQDYNLGTPRNVTKNRDMLESKDIIEIYGGGIHFSDPIFKYWLSLNN
jgi:hypothetical protein